MIVENQEVYWRANMRNTSIRWLFSFLSQTTGNKNALTRQRVQKGPQT